jgi:hypothetical protein
MRVLLVPITTNHQTASSMPHSHMKQDDDGTTTTTMGWAQGRAELDMARARGEDNIISGRLTTLEPFRNFSCNYLAISSQLLTLLELVENKCHYLLYLRIFSKFRCN